jgi:hypothetical protein
MQLDALQYARLIRCLPKEVQTMLYEYYAAITRDIMKQLEIKDANK